MLTGTASIGPDHGETELDARARAALGDPGELFIVDQLEVGMRSADDEPVVDDPRRAATAPATRSRWPRSSSGSPSRTPGTPPTAARRRRGAGDRADGDDQRAGQQVRAAAGRCATPSLGLFLDLEVRLLDGPVFVDQAYALEREIVGLGQSRRTESYWTRTTLTDADTGVPVAAVLLHSGVFKESYPGYPSR